jgi:hypothetical protein
MMTSNQIIIQRHDHAKTKVLGAEAFMNYLAELQHKYIERVSQEFVAYFETEPVARLSRNYHSNPHGSTEESQALLNAVADLPPHRFSDGVELNMSRYLLLGTKPAEIVPASDSTRHSNFTITLQRARKRVDKLLFIIINDVRFSDNRRHIRELISVPLDFYNFLRCNLCNFDDVMSYTYLKEYVQHELARQGDSICVFDRPAKLKALAEVLAA